MTQYIEIELDDQVLKFEVGKEDFIGEMAVSGVTQRIRNVLPDMQNIIRGVSALVSKTVDSLHEKPAETTIEFGINVKAEIGAMVANSSTEAQIKVALKWTDDEPSKK